MGVLAVIALYKKLKINGALVMRNFFKILFCDHSFSLKIKEYYGDAIVYNSFHRSLWKCDKCGCVSGSDYLDRYEKIK